MQNTDYRHPLTHSATLFLGTIAGRRRFRLNTLRQDPPGIPITKLPPGRERKSLRYDRKRSRGKPIPFSRLHVPRREDSNDDAITTEDHVNALAAGQRELEPYQAQFWDQRRNGPESEAARIQREEVLDRAAGKINLGPLLEQAPKVCSLCSEPIAGDEPRTHILAVLQPHVGMEVRSIEPLQTRCERCSGAQRAEPIQEIVPQERSEEFLEMLNEQERRVYQLEKQGLSQDEIGRRIGKSQGTVSRIQKRIEGKRTEWRRQRYRETGA